jgi:hypothetical protein
MMPPVVLKVMAARGLFLMMLATSQVSDALHPRNAFQGSYDMVKLVAACPALKVCTLSGAFSRCSTAWCTIRNLKV